MASDDDRALFGKVVLPYLSDAYALARWIAGNRADAEDIVQEASLRAFRSVGDCRERSARAWLLTVVRNTAYTWLRKNRPAALVGVADIEAVERAQAASANPQAETPETSMIARADAAQLEAAIAALPTQFRETLVLRDLQGLDYREIAEVTAVPIGTVMSRLARADNVTLLVHAYLDGELDPANTLALEQRIERDTSLAAEVERIAALKHALRERLPSEAAPAGLRTRIEKSVGIEHAKPRPNWRALAASVALTALVVGSATWTLRAPSPRDAVREAVIASHIRSLMAPQPVDVASSDQHIVKPWFNGRIPQSPRVVDLAARDFPLIGARLDVLGREAVPTLVYRRRKHLISVTAMPVAAQTPAEPAQNVVDGYNVLRWSDGGVAYWAISDLDAQELANFVQLFRGEAARP
jgi:RNA polymerase sigma-70 factor (ECF subfamily)